MSQDASPLFTPFRAGALDLSNRVVMAPLTRSRADDETGTVSDLHVTYYTQRASAGLIITEAAQISPQGKGYISTPGIYTSEQVAAWRKVTDAVHEAGGKIVIQLWHVGRISHTEFQPDRQKPVAPSAIGADVDTYLSSGYSKTSVPRALDADEIAGIVLDYVHATNCAMEAGFDGVELHAANGYLIDQFLKDGTNKRGDRYGGSIENRTRFLFEIMDAMTGAVDADRIGIRLSPFSAANNATESDPMGMFTPVVERLNRYGLAYLHMVEGQTGGERKGDYDALRQLWTGPYMGNNAYDRSLAISRVADGSVDLVAFGRPFIANPDLPERLRQDATLNKPDPDTMYGGEEGGYIDYPTLEEERAEAS
ncbi:alkene reductase [Palleronia caenipelagi]|uniref:Alkene reductase n=1 Tax=Palleronia caenipelagi TaxID=2489174 RepID=A0A547PNQ2_9RHOB|nr:alkene reductase [Palleronia caenipelagi]TRD15664.1 alkene reductase [Palleronia caenipelagi]